MDTKDMNGRKIYKVRGIPQANIPWTEIPVIIRSGLEHILKGRRSLEKVSKEKHDKNPIIDIINWVSQSNINCSNSIRFDVKYIKEKELFIYPKKSLSFDIIYNLKEKRIVPSELWICESERGAYFETPRRLYFIDPESEEIFKQYARKII